MGMSRNWSSFNRNGGANGGGSGNGNSDIGRVKVARFYEEKVKNGLIDLKDVPNRYLEYFKNK